MTVQSTRKFTRKLITALLAAWILPVALPMFPADAAPSYKPPRRQSAKRTENSGTRSQLSKRIGSDLKGCAKDLPVPLTLVVPEEQKNDDDKSSVTPETNLAKPSLYVYLSAPRELRFSLDQGAKQVWTKKQKNDTTGIIEIPYPDDELGLEVGKTYTWSVGVVCESEDILALKTNVVGSRVTRVWMPLAVRQQLKTATTPRQRAEIYANAGLWPETLMSTMKARNSGTDPAAQQDFLSLLKDIKLDSIGGLPDSSKTSAPVVAPSPDVTVTPSANP
jgi:Domain of Unknown Function (DUF928)